MYHAGKKTNHDYPTDFEYLPFDVFAHCHKDIDTNMHYHATEIVTNGYEIELKPPNTVEQWEINQKDWRKKVDGNTNREYNKALLGHFADDSQPGHLKKDLSSAYTQVSQKRKHYKHSPSTYTFPPTSTGT